MRKVDKWGKRRLAYEIQKKQYGFYGSIEFEGVGNIPKELESEYNFNDKVLRYLTYRYDKRKLKAMAMEKEEQAVTSSAPTTPAPEAKPTPAPAVEEPVKETVTETPAEEPQAPETKNEEQN